MDPTVSLVEIEMPPLDEPFIIPMDIFPDQVELLVEAEVENVAEEPQVKENYANSEKEPGVSQQRLQSATLISSPTSCSCDELLVHLHRRSYLKSYDHYRKLGPAQLQRIMGVGRERLQF
jgi:hypothetical protein